ncbi:bpX6 domain-containing protein [Myxococcus sp. MxC21-1]|uniref:bpX6 domain-containing protein n=1 Tax=Myxococcus sp. MxC21-1 TaxID=3041439 RepID=UPI00292DFACE|nr:bpX6 domain-containing protein [Myxococcus sp. MxC21-1]WNZ61812.1 bpX6 domain-containing protein [Myxococcus sp. MxC21-1]
MSTARAGLRPRQQVHRGTVRASAFWLDPALLGDAEARRRILAEWTPGMSVHAVAGGYLVEMSAPRAVVCEAAPGLPLTREHGVLSSAPLSPAERRHPSLHEGAVLLVLRGRSLVFSAGAMPRVDVSTWLDVSAWSIRAPETLGAPPPPCPCWSLCRRRRANASVPACPSRHLKHRKCSRAWRGAALPSPLGRAARDGGRGCARNSPVRARRCAEAASPSVAGQGGWRGLGPRSWERWPPEHHRVRVPGAGCPTG